MDIQTEYRILHELDDKLLLLQKRLYFQKYLTPLNLAEERKIFLEHNGQYSPQFRYYFPSEGDILDLRKTLIDLQQEYFGKHHYTLPIHTIFQDKLQENILMTDLFLAYIRQDFSALHTLQTRIYGTFDEDLFAIAKQTLDEYQDPDPIIRGATLDSKQIGERIQQYLLDHHISDVTISPSSSGFNSFVLIIREHACILTYSENISLREHELEAHLIHELGIHYQRYAAGKQSGRKILMYGTAGYARDEEGLALTVMCQYKRTFVPHYRKKSIYQKYYLLHQSQGKSFVEIAKIIKDSGIATGWNKIFTMVAAMKQGIQDTSIACAGNITIKNKIYLEGQERLHQRMTAGNDLSLLLLGKIKIEDIPPLLG